MKRVGEFTIIYIIITIIIGLGIFIITKKMLHKIIKKENILILLSFYITLILVAIIILLSLYMIGI